MGRRINQIHFVDNYALPASRFCGQLHAGFRLCALIRTGCEHRVDHAEEIAGCGIDGRLDRFPCGGESAPERHEHRAPTRGVQGRDAKHCPNTERPRHMVRRPQRLPLSRAIGMRPARAVTHWRSNQPIFGNSAMSVAATTGPLPATVFSR